MLALIYACVLLTAHAMWLCEDPGSGQFGLSSVLSLQPTRKMAQKEDTCQTKGNKLFGGLFCMNVLLSQFVLLAEMWIYLNSLLEAHAQMNKFLNILRKLFGLGTIYYTTWNIVSKVPLILRNTTIHTNTHMYSRNCYYDALVFHSFKLKIRIYC